MAYEDWGFNSVNRLWEYSNRDRWQEELKEVMVKLQKYCHSTGCKTPANCPRECCYSGRGWEKQDNLLLDLDTGIAWEAQEAIDNFIDFDENDDYELQVDTLLSVVSQHAGRTPYKKLHKLLQRASELMGKL
jgi:hypothetical protein